MKTQYYINSFSDGSAMWIVELTKRRFIEHALDEKGIYSRTESDPAKEAPIGHGQPIDKDCAVDLIRTMRRIAAWNGNEQRRRLR